MKFFEEEKVETTGWIVLVFAMGLLLFCAFNRFSTTVSKKVEPLHLRINEVMVSNQGAYLDSNGNAYDWVELANEEDFDVSLDGYTLVDNNPNNVVELKDLVIPAKGYLLLYLTGEQSSGSNYLSFALNKAGDELTLKNPEGEVVSSISFGKTKENYTLAYEGDAYVETSSITPLEENSIVGRMKYLKSRMSISSPLKITEFLPQNKGIYRQGSSLYEYIEITNVSSEKVSLKDYYLSVDSKKPYFYALPEIELEPKQHYLLYPTKLSLENHAPFELNKKSGTIYLSTKNQVIDTVSYEVTKEGYAFSWDGEEWVETTSITPGFDNTVSGRKSYAKSEKIESSLIINEVMTSNDKYLKEQNGKYYDWIEIKNPTKKDISLKGYYLATNVKDKDRFALPNKTLKEGATMVLLASNENPKKKKYTHTNFKLSEGESLYLYQGDTLIDSMFIPELKVGMSYGWGSSYGHYYFSTPTPNKKNGSGNIDVTLTPTFSLAPGVYNDLTKVTLSLSSNGTIYYTLDGSVPNKNSKKYTKPITITKTTVVRAIAYGSSMASSEVATGSYILHENHTLPVVSLSLPNSSFNTLNQHYQSRSLEYKAHAEFYEEDGSFSIDCGLKLFGGQSRELPKKSYALKFSSQYGEGNLSYRVFDNREIVNYNTLVLRSGSQDMEGSMIRDELASSVIEELGTIDVQAFRPVILYINGKYWGIYYLREKVDDRFIAQHYNVEQGKTNIVKIENELEEGSRADFQKLMNYVRSHDLSNAKYYHEVEKMLDMDNYIDFLVSQFYMNNIDVRNTRFFSHPSVVSGKIRMIFYDLDYGFRTTPVYFLPWLLNPAGTGYFKVDNSLIRGLMKSDLFKKHFLEVFFYDMKYVFTKEKVLAKYKSLYKLVQPEMKRNQERWGFSYDTFESSCDAIERFIKNRTNNMISQVQSYFHLTDAEVKKYMDTSNPLRDKLKRESLIVQSSM